MNRLLKQIAARPAFVVAALMMGIVVPLSLFFHFSFSGFVILSLLIFFLIEIAPVPGFSLLLCGLAFFYFGAFNNLIFRLGTANIYAIDMVYAALTLAIAVQLVSRGFRRLVKSRSSIFFLSYFVWGIFEIGRGIPRFGYSAVGESRLYVLPLLFYFYIPLKFDGRGIRKMLGVLLGFIPAMVAIKILQFLFFNSDLPSYRSSFDERILFIDTFETLLFSFVILFLFSLYLHADEKESASKNRIAFMIMVSLCLLIFVQQRAVWVATFVGIVASLLVFHRFKKIILFLFVFSLFVALVQLSGDWVLGKSRMTKLRASIAQSAGFVRAPEEDVTGKWRIAGWRQEFDKAMEHPIIGNGFGGYSEWLDTNYEWQKVFVHNGYIMWFSKTGAIGLLLLLGGAGFWYRETAGVLGLLSGGRRLVLTAIGIFVLMNMVYAFFYDFYVVLWILLSSGTVWRDWEKAEPMG